MIGQKAVDYADVQAEKTLAGRAIGERPEMFESKAAGLATMYQLEVSNYIQQVAKEMTPKQAAKTMLAGYAISSLMQTITGSGIGFNPIDAAIDSFGYITDDAEDEKAKKVAQRFTGEVLDNTPVVGPLLDFAAGDRYVKSIAGEDSNIGKFGVSSGISTLFNNPTDLVTPFGGSQFRKTKGALDDIQRGYAQNRSGDPTFGAPDNVISQAQTLLYGRNAGSNAQNYYDKDLRPITGKKDLAEIEGAKGQPDINKVVDNIQNRRLLEREEQKEKDAKRAAGEPTETSSDPYKLLTEEYSPAKREDAREEYGDVAIDKAIKTAGDDLNKRLRDSGLPVIKVDEDLAYEYAKYREAIKDQNEIEVANKTRSLYTKAYKSQMDDLTQSFYKLSDDKMRSVIKQGKISKKQLSTAIAIDNLLTENGMQPYLRIGKTLRKELGYGIPDSVAKSSGKGGRKSTKPKVNLSNYVETTRVPKTETRASSTRPDGSSLKLQQVVRRKQGKRPQSAPKISVKRGIA